MNLRRPLNYRSINYDKLLDYQCRKGDFRGIAPPTVPYVPEPAYIPPKKKKKGNVYYKVKIEDVSTGDL